MRPFHRAAPELSQRLTFIACAVRSHSRFLPVLFALSWGLCSASVTANPLRETLSELMQTSPRAVAVQSDKESAAQRITETSRRAWTPQLELNYELGNQQYRTNTQSDVPRLDTNRTSLKLSQLLYDFGQSNRKVDESESVAAQAATVAGATVDGLLLEALIAHWSVVRAQRTLEYARQSEASVRKQANLENSLVELGKGYESNVLQAKVQLASSEARRNRADGAVDVAYSRVRAVFGALTPKVTYDMVAKPLAEKIPKTLDEAIQIALENNKQLQIGLHRSQAIKQRIGVTESREFFPTIKLVAEEASRNNTDTALDGSWAKDSKLYVQFQYAVNLGMAGRYAAEAARQELQASVTREMETRDLTIEQVSIGWRNLLVARQNKETLSNQVRIAAKFLEMATAERQLGRRTLLDVLTAEVALINALSDLVSTEADEAIASLNLLQAIGKLDVDAFVEVPVESVMPAISNL